MSDLIAIAYPDEAAARRAHANLADGVEKGLLEVEDVVVVAYDQDGRIVPLLSGWAVGLATFGGAVAGGLIGLILLGPLLGMVAGGAAAGTAAHRKLSADDHVSQRFLTDLWEQLTPGSAAMVLLVRQMSPEMVLPHIHEPGEVIQTSLGPQVEAQLDAALAAAKRKP